MALISCLYLFYFTIIIADVDIHFDGQGVYISDAIGRLYWVDISTNQPVSSQLNATDLVVNEVSFDWLSRKLYVTSNDYMVRFYQINGELGLPQRPPQDTGDKKDSKSKSSHWGKTVT